MPVWLILLATSVYVIGLFMIAWQGDRRADEGRGPKPVTYALALAVYCTSWTYFGAVGTAASSGWDFLPIYLGPAVVFLLFPVVIRRIGDVCQREGISTLADFLASRFGKSRSVGALATLIALAGSLPYIALQLKSVGSSFIALADDGALVASQPAHEAVFVTAIAMAAFAILFGARQSDATKRNTGLMRVLALEAVVKLGALVAVALLSITLIGRSDASTLDAAAAPFRESPFSERFLTITLLSMAAIICLPRQFHVAMIERRDGSEVSTARWLFPAYLAVTSLVVIPITLAGSSVLPAGSAADLFVLSLPLSQGDGLLALLVFLGGFSAATGMIIVATIAVSTMVTNELVVPAIMRSGRFDVLGGQSGARLTRIRRIVIVAIVLLAYAYYRAAGSGEALAQIGLLSFAAAVQFAPALIGGVFWRGARRAGALAGMALGAGMWLYTLFLPAVVGIETLQSVLPSWANPHGLFGLSLGDPLTHGVVWSLVLNGLGFVIGSARSRERLRDRIQAAAFVSSGQRAEPDGERAGTGVVGVSPNGLKTLASRFLNTEAVDHAFTEFSRTTGLKAEGDDPADWRLVQRTERLLATALGASSARVVLSSAIGGNQVSLPDVLSILDHKTQAERFERHMLQSMLENISQGISMVDNEQRLVAWNSAYLDLFDYPSDLVRVGVPVADLIEHNISRGWVSGDPAQEARRRVDYMKSGRAHVFERQVPDGRHFRIAGHPMPGGGYVTTYTDITEDKLRQAELIAANETLEERVAERTRDLAAMADDLDLARREAEGANASKTRFLAAASHDLLQPLNAARLFLGSLKSRAPDNADLVSRVDKSIQAADELLRGLLDISRLDQSNVVAKPVALPLGPLMEDLADEAAPMAERAGIEIRVAPTRLTGCADPDFLKSVLRNFLSNARRYTRQGGVLIGARRRGDGVRIEVWDTGPGISETDISRIFGEFERAAETDNIGLRGAGLGLSVSKRLADIMDAPIDVRSRPGKGSVFSITIPLARTPGSRRRSTDEARSAPTHDVQGLRVLFVDDEAGIVEGMTSLLESWGCDVVGETTREGVKAALARSGFDALIADLQLGNGADGLDLIQRHRNTLSDPANVLLLTAQADDTTRRRAAQRKVTVMRKPADPDAIRAFLSACEARLRQAETHPAAE